MIIRPLIESVHEGVVSEFFQTILISSIEFPQCLSFITICSSVIVDSGALVCISLHQSDFVTYNNSKMMIKDLSSLNQAADEGEGILRCSLQDAYGDSIVIELLCYHIPNAEVCLLSPQGLLNTIGSHTLQTVNGIDFVLENGTNFCAHLCLQSNLPLIPLALGNDRKYCFWNEAFGYTVHNVQAINGLKSILSHDNTNLSSSQKEFLLWHQRLSHASIGLVQMLMHDRKWLLGHGNAASLHSGPFIKTKRVVLWFVIP
jgi:hypothetical protein